MPLRIELKPFERVIIGNASIRNGQRRASFVVETHSKVLREADIITQSEADTPCKQLYFAIENMYLADDPRDLMTPYTTLANEIVVAAPSTAALVDVVDQRVQERDFYQALKLAKLLVDYETRLLASLHSSLAQGNAGVADDTGAPAEITQI